MNRTLTLTVMIAAVAIGWKPTAASGEPFSLTLPANARQSQSGTQPDSTATLPVGPAVRGIVPTQEFAGLVVRQAWRLPGGQRTTLQLINPLRAQLSKAGFDLALDCETQSCGGFDFRFAIEVLPEPAMHVDLGDFRYVLGTRAEDGGATQAIAILVSRSAASGFVQIVRVLPDGLVAAGEFDGAVKANGPVVPESSTVISETPETFDPLDMIRQLETQGYAVLDDVSFDSGSFTLADRTYPSLELLASYLKSNPDRAVAVVGHTDATGSLDGNITLSRRRAAAVMDRLVGKFGVPKAQVAADGVGFLAPRASNLTDDGRTLNRRVEVILTSTQ